MNTPRVLLVDDDAVVLDALETLLTNHGYNTVACQDGAQALELVLQKRCDLVILDIGLPSPDPGRVSRFDGIKVLQWLRRLHREVPVLVFTSNDKPEVAKEALEAGARGVIIKGAPIEKFLAAIQQAMAPKQEPEANASRRGPTTVVWKDNVDGLAQ